MPVMLDFKTLLIVGNATSSDTISENLQEVNFYLMQKSFFRRYEISYVYRRAIGHSPPNRYLQVNFNWHISYNISDVVLGKNIIAFLLTC